MQGMSEESQKVIEELEQDLRIVRSEKETL